MFFRYAVAIGVLTAAIIAILSGTASAAYMAWGANLPHRTSDVRLVYTPRSSRCVTYTRPECIYKGGRRMCFPVTNCTTPQYRHG
jgi:hypothetical protein